MSRPIAVFRKYRTILGICLVERFTYRTDFIVGTLMRFMPIVTTIFLWQAVFAGSGSERIVGFSHGDFVAYYLLVMVGRAFSSMPGLSGSIAADVRTGNLKKFLTQPVSMLGFYFVSRVAHKLVYYGVASLPFVIVFYLCGEYFPPVPRAEVLLAFALSLVMAFLIGFLFEASIGLVAFWFLEVGSLTYVIMSLSYVLSGHMFPLDLFGEGWFRQAINFTPFPFLAYFPANVYLRGDEWSSARLWSELMTPAAWVLALALICRTLNARGLRRYSAFGG